MAWVRLFRDGRCLALRHRGLHRPPRLYPLRFFGGGVVTNGRRTFPNCASSIGPCAFSASLRSASVYFFQNRLWAGGRRFAFVGMVASSASCQDGVEDVFVVTVVVAPRELVEVERQMRLRH